MQGPSLITGVDCRLQSSADVYRMVDRMVGVPME
jgi:hypothetical protein